MNKITFKGFLTFLFMFGILYTNAQGKGALVPSKKYTIKKQTPIQSKVASNAIGFQLTDATKESINRTGYARCLTDENEITLQQKYPNRTSQEEFENWLAPKLEKVKADRASGKSRKVIYNIPVVIHIVHNGDAIGSGENITDAQALSQIQVMNEDFRRLAGTPGGANTTGLAVDVEINFCIAQQDPSGNFTNGVVRHNITPYSNLQTPSNNGDWEIRADVETMKTNTQWNPTKYLNMWTIRPGGNALDDAIDPGLSGLLGYAQFPSNSGLGGLNPNGGAANTDGVVAGFDVMGTIAEDDGTFIINPTYNLGRTMTHEVGHWVGLRHIWGDGNCSADDFCADTPNAGNPNYTCNVVDSCPASAGNDQIQNYMDYTNDACMDTFTQDQKDRIVAVMTNSPRRMELSSSNTCNATAPTIFFASTTLSQPEGSDCSFTDVAIPVNIALGASQNALVTFAVNASTTGTNGVDFTLQTPTVSFAQGATVSQDMVLRVYNDSFVEGDETVTIDFTVNANGGDAVAGNNSFTLTIVDDDSIPQLTTTTTLYSQDFDPFTGGLSISDMDGDGNNWGFNNEAAYGTNIGFSGQFALSLSYDGTSGLNPDNLIYNTDAIQIPADATNIKLTFDSGTIESDPFDAEFYSVYISTTGTAAGIIATTPVYTETLDYATGGFTTREIILDNSFANEGIYFGFRHHNTFDMNTLIIDNILITYDVVTNIQTSVNTGTTNAQLDFPNAGTVYAVDTSGDLMLDITNNNADDYGCTAVSVSRSGIGAQAYNGSASPAFVTDKTFTITPTNTIASGDTDITFYFTDAEITGWETATGLSRNNLFAHRAGSNDIVALTNAAFGSDVALTGAFTGLDGTYYFGPESAFRVTVSPKVFLQGAALNPNTGEETLMRDDLRVANMIPLTSPYDSTIINASVLNTTGTDAIVDWVFVELRDANTNTTVVASQSALLQRDGDVVSIDGVTPLVFMTSSNNYYVVIKHKSHLGIMSANTIVLDMTLRTVDFTNGTTATFGADAQTAFGMPSGVVAMWAGDANGDGRLNYIGALSDVLLVRNQVFNDPNNSVFGGPPVANYLSQGYYATDANMDGITVYIGAISDVLYIRNNIFNNPSNSVFGGPPISTYLFTQQLPEGANN